MSSNPRVRRLKSRVVRLKARIGRLKARVQVIKPRVKIHEVEKFRDQNIELHELQKLLFSLPREC